MSKRMGRPVSLTRKLLLLGAAPAIVMFIVLMVFFTSARLDDDQHCTGLVGFANVGLTAELFGAANAVWIIGLEGVIPMLLIGWGWKELRN